MSVRKSATQCSGIVPDSGYIPATSLQSRRTKPSNRWLGNRVRFQDDIDSSDRKNSTPQPIPQNSFSNDAVKAWLDSSPTSVLDQGSELEFQSTSVSPYSSPPRSGPINSNYGHDHAASSTRPSATTRGRVISPPRFPVADINNEQPPNIERYGPLPSRDVQIKARRDRHLQDANEGSQSPASDFSLSVEWNAMLAAAAASATQDVSDNETIMNSENARVCGTPLTSDRPQVFLKPPRTMENYQDTNFPSMERDPMHAAPRREFSLRGQSMPTPQFQEQATNMERRAAAVEVKDILMDNGRVGSRKQAHNHTGLLSEVESNTRGAGPGSGVAAALDRRRTYPAGFNDENAPVGYCNGQISTAAREPMVASAHAIMVANKSLRYGSFQQEHTSASGSLKQNVNYENVGSSRSSPNTSSLEKGVETNPMALALQTAKQQKVASKAAAWEEAENSKLSNRYKREELKILSWEDHQRAKASISMKRAEMKLEGKRARAMEKMQNEIAIAHKKAEEKKAIAEAKRAEKAAKAAAEAERIRASGKVPHGCFPF